MYFCFFLFVGFDSRAERTEKVYFLKWVSDDFQYDILSMQFS
jgi:hypothetical protein